MTSSKPAPSALNRRWFTNKKQKKKELNQFSFPRKVVQTLWKWEHKGIGTKQLAYHYAFFFFFSFDCLIAQFGSETILFPTCRDENHVEIQKRKKSSWTTSHFWLLLIVWFLFFFFWMFWTISPICFYCFSWVEDLS